MRRKKHLVGLVLALAVSENATAMLLGVVQSYPDITLNQNYLVYDNNAIDSNTGLLKLVSYASTLNEGPGSGNSTLTQSYSGAGDPLPNLMLTIAIDRNTGNWINTANPIANKVSIGFGNSVIPNGSTNTPGFSWQGNINDFGWNSTGTFFDAKWTLTGDDYEDMPATLAQFTDGVLTSAMAAYMGGIKISNSSGFGTVGSPSAFQQDWVFGASANSLSIQTLLNNAQFTECSTGTQSDCTINFVHSTVTSDVFLPIPVASALVPIPAAMWLWAGALAIVTPSIKRIKSRKLAGSL